MELYKKYCRERFDGHGVLTDFEVIPQEDFNFAYDVVDKIAAEEPSKRAMVWCNTEGEERCFTFSDVSRESNRIANVLSSSGIKKGDMVLVVLKRHYEYWFTVVALHKIGAVAIPATHMLTVKDFEYRLSTSRAAAVICTVQNGVPQKVLSAVANAGVKPKLWCAGQQEGFRNLIAEAEAAADTFMRVPTCISEPMLLYFTSGTTGQPKGVIHDFSYPLAHIVTAKYWQQAEDGGLHFAVAETGWAKASWGKIYGQWLVGCAVMVYDFDNFDPKQLFAVINRYGVTSFCAPPTIYRYMVRTNVGKMPSLKHASTAGEKLAAEVFHAFYERTGLKISEGYGQTETTLLTGNFAGRQVVDGSMGMASPMYNVQLQNSDGGAVPCGEVGEVVVVPKEGKKQTGIFGAYLDNDELYAHAWRGGVYHTGDAAWQDKDGHFWFYGRFDDIIKTGGFRVGPSEIESILEEHPAVGECCVVGVPDELRGQAIRAYVVPASGSTASASLKNSIKSFCNERLAEYKWIREVEFVCELPKTISGKTRRAALRGRV